MPKKEKGVYHIPEPPAPNRTLTENRLGNFRPGEDPEIKVPLGDYIPEKKDDRFMN